MGLTSFPGRVSVREENEGIFARLIKDSKNDKAVLGPYRIFFALGFDPLAEISLDDLERVKDILFGVVIY